MSNVPESSRLPNPPLCENASSSDHKAHTTSDQIPGVQFNKDAARHILPGTKFNMNQQTHSFQQGVHVPQNLEIEGSHPATIQSPNTGCNSNRQSLSDCHNVGEKRCDTREMLSPTELRTAEFTETSGSYSIQKWLSEPCMNPDLELALEQSGNNPMFQGSHSSLYARHPSISNIYQKARSTSYDMSGNEARGSQLMNGPVYFQYMPGRHHDLSLQSLQNSKCQSKRIQSLHPQGVQQSKVNPNMIRETPTARPVVMANPSISNQYLSPQPVANEACELQESDFPPKAVAQNNPNKRPFPDSSFQQELKLGPSCVLSAESLPSTSRDFYPVPENSSAMDSEKPNKSDRRSKNVDSKENVSSPMFSFPNNGTYERINIVVYGPADRTARFLQPYAEEALWQFDTPCQLSFERNFIRGSTLVFVSVWKTVDIMQSLYTLRGFWSFSKTTILILINMAKFSELSDIRPPIVLIRRNISRDIPIILAIGKVDRRKRPALTLCGYRMKAKYDLSGCLEYAFGFRQEVENVFLTAVDVSFLKNIQSRPGYSEIVV